jgi:hypothetical protein
MVIRFLRGASVPLLLIGMLIVAGITADRVYSGNLLTLLVAGAAVGSVGLSMLFSRLPAWAVAPLSTLGLAGYLAFALWESARAAAIPDPLATIAVETLRDGIPRLLAALVPIEPQPDTIAVPVLATWIAGLAATELAVRARRTTAALTLPVLLYAGALWLAGPVHGVVLWPALAFGAMAVATLAITGRVKTPESGVDSPTRTALRLRTAVAAGVGVALILGATVAGGTAAEPPGQTEPTGPAQSHRSAQARRARRKSADPPVRLGLGAQAEAV